MINKIFGIGLSKTGTASLTLALKILGYDSVHWEYTRETISYLNREIYICPNKFNNYIGFTDTPITRTFKHLDKLFPDSKFIYTVRDINDWLKSCEKFFCFDLTKEQIEKRMIKLTDRNNLLLDLYDSLQYDKNKFLKAYKSHHDDVLNYFKDRENDILIMDICSGDNDKKWSKLCNFLNKNIPDRDFPKENISKY